MNHKKETNQREKEAQWRFAITEDRRYQGYEKHKLSNMMTFTNNKEAFLKRDLG